MNLEVFLDNKVYITLLACGLLYGMISIFYFKMTIFQMILNMVCIIFLVFAVGMSLGNKDYSIISSTIVYLFLFFVGYVAFYKVLKDFNVSRSDVISAMFFRKKKIIDKVEETLKKDDHKYNGQV